MNLKTGFLSALLFGSMASTAHATVLADFTAGALTLTAQNEAQIVVTCNTGNVAVNGSSALTPGTVLCAGVVSLAVNGDALDNTIDLSGMQAGQFSALTGASLFGGIGNDQIVGSFVADVVTGGPGNDSIDLGDGDDTSVWNNGDNTDVVLGGVGNDRQIVNGAPVGDIFTVIPGVAPVAVRFDRSNLVPFGIDLSTVETLELNGLAGDDNISAETLTAGLISLVINGGDGNDILVGSKGDDVITGGIGNAESGTIEVGGVELQNLDLQNYRRQIGYVPQDSFLFNSSMRRNLTLGHGELDLSSIEDAARMAEIHDFISTQPMGYETRVGESGAKLSGGQRQRLAIARAIAGAPALLILDEATSSLDSQTERAVSRNLQDLQCTQLSIAHRLSTVCSCDVIFVIEAGRVTAQGSHQELVITNDFYRTSFLQQGQVSEDVRLSVHRQQATAE